MALPKSQVATLTLRDLSLLFLLLSFIILITNKNTESEKYACKALYSYSYLFGIGIIGIAYTLFQIIAYVMFWIVMENDKGILFELYGDKVISYVLATAAAAGIGASIDFKNYNDGFYNTRYFNMGFVSAGCLLLAFVCTASSPIMPSYALQKKV